MNGIELDPNRIAAMAAAADQRTAMLIQMRVGIAAGLLAPLLAQEYARGLAAGIAAAYPFGPSEDEPIDMGKVKVNFNVTLPVQVAIGAADLLMQQAGAVK